MSAARTAAIVAPAPVDASAILAALPYPVLVVDVHGVVAEVNVAAEAFFAASRRRLIGKGLAALLPVASPLIALVDEASRHLRPSTARGLDLSTPIAGRHPFVDVMVAPLAEDAGHLVVTLIERSIATMMERQLTHRSAARALAGLSAVLAHEIKNPLSGIRGAAQLLETDASEEGRALTGLICAETDRICRLVDRMQDFGAGDVTARESVNIHEVLEHVRTLAGAGFAKGVAIVERYDPSLPGIPGNRDRLIQALLNLVKNAADAVANASDARIVLQTSFRPGLHHRGAASGMRESLPLAITIEDNGPGVPESLRPHIFDPFVTAKSGGSGLGLALVAKIVEEHGGIVELDQEPGRTMFRIALPIVESEP